MDFEIPRFERVPIKETNVKDVNQLFKDVVEIGFGTFGYPQNNFKVEFIRHFRKVIPASRTKRAKNMKKMGYL